MLTVATPFPWWLWILAGLWIGSIVMRRGLAPQSEWGRWLDGLIIAYTALLLYMSLKSAWPVDWTWGPWLRACVAGVSTIAVLGGGLVSLRGPDNSRRSWGSGIAYLGLSGFAVCLESYELAVIGGIACGLVLLDRAAESGIAPRPLPRSMSVLVAVAATVVCVGWLGLVHYAARVELHRPGPSRWFTAIPAVESVQRWRQGTGAAASPAVSPEQLSWAVGVFALCLLGRRSPRQTPLDSPSAVTVLVETPS